MGLLRLALSFCLHFHSCVLSFLSVPCLFIHFLVCCLVLPSLLPVFLFCFLIFVRSRCLRRLLCCFFLCLRTVCSSCLLARCSLFCLACLSLCLALSARPVSIACPVCLSLTLVDRLCPSTPLTSVERHLRGCGGGGGAGGSPFVRHQRQQASSMAGIASSPLAKYVAFNTSPAHRQKQHSESSTPKK